MARHESTIRVFRIIHYLETTKAGLKVSEIHQRLKDDHIDVDIRTVHRDIELLQEVHIPVMNEGSGPESHWKLAPFAEIRSSIQFTYQEIFSLFVARKSLDHLKGTPLYSALDNMFTKLEKLLGHQAEVFQELLGNVAFKPQMTWHTSVAPVVLDTVYAALEEGHALRIVYKAEGGAKPGMASERVVGPECLYFANGSVYLIAIDLTKNEPRTYALARIQDAEMTTDEYEKTGVTPEALFKSSLGVLSVGEPDDVEVLLTGPVATFFAERKWHDSQEVIKQSDGILLRFHLRINDELARFVLGMGPTAVVNKPESLRQRVSEMASEIQARYLKKAS